MMRTIVIGSCVMVQGLLEKTLPDGRLVVRVDNQIFTGLPVNRAA